MFVKSFCFSLFFTRKTLKNNEIMKKYLGNIGGLWLGFSISVFTGLHFWNWEFYMIIVPTIIFFVFDKNLNK